MRTGMQDRQARKLQTQKIKGGMEPISITSTTLNGERK
jgi:hypothetical protein